MILLTCIIKVDQSHFYVKKHAAGLFHLIRKKNNMRDQSHCYVKKHAAGLFHLIRQKNKLRDQTNCYIKKHAEGLLHLIRKNSNMRDQSHCYARAKNIIMFFLKKFQIFKVNQSNSR